MARKEEDTSAISLFSFQDIITSITGIMFLVVLLLVLIMLTSHDPTPQPEQPESEENREMLAQIATLQQQLEELKNIHSSVDEELKKLRELSPAAIEAKIRELEKQLQQKAEAIKQALKNLEKDKTALEELERKVKKINNGLSPKQEMLKKLEAEHKNLEKQIKDKKASIEQKKKIMEFSIDNTTNKIPVLVEIDKDGCQVMNVTNGKHVDLRVSNNFSASLQKLWKYLANNCNPSSSYITLVIKPSAFPYVENMLNALKQKNYERGVEILPNEKTSIFEVK